ncbi:hypothetical protein A6A06_25965 [Streptomyces sp. CB02923]|uniref:hypothetical protein n=1 Tax=Streptomyces sp. CB02923 TaxID=1718985 RepID=UPI000940370D|nr:hypothetical protein A6A06_25965 [Streptomyces sp. CB02923]
MALENAAGTARRPALSWRLVRDDGLWNYDPAPPLAVLLDQLGGARPYRCWLPPSTRRSPR